MIFHFFILLAIAIPLFSVLLPTFAPLNAQIVINEIMYNPAGADNYTEYVELRNLGEEVSLRGWQISDGTAADSLFEALNNEIPRIPSQGYALILDSGYWSLGGGIYDDRIPPETLLLTVHDAAIGSGGLSNSESEPVMLLNAGGDTVSIRLYVAGAPDGSSEERIEPSGGEDDTNWAFSIPGGTPGHHNSVTPWPDDLRLLQLEVFAELSETGFLLPALIQIQNAGTDTSLQTSVVFQIRRYPDGADSLLGQFDVSPVAPDSLITESGTFTSFQPNGDYLVTAALSPPDDNPANDTTLALVTLYRPPEPVNAGLTFTELMPFPPDTPSGSEWVELRLDQDTPLDVAGWGIQDAGGAVARIPGQPRTLEPDSLLVLAPSTDVLNWTGLRQDQLCVTTGWPSLNNDGDTLRLLDPNSFVIREIVYGQAAEGQSLIRRTILPDPDVSEWFPCIYAPFASPGRDNQAVFPPSELQIESFDAHVPGELDSLIVAFELRSEGWFIELPIPWVLSARSNGERYPVNSGTLHPPDPGASQWFFSATATSGLNGPGWTTISLELDFLNPDPRTVSDSADVFIPATEPVTPGPALTVSPNPFSPDGDGHEDRTTFHFNLPSDEILITIRLFDSVGRPVGVIARDRRVPGQGEWTWDGRSGLTIGVSLPLGLYAFVADIQSFDGAQSWRVKGALASAGGR